MAEQNPYREAAETTAETPDDELALAEKRRKVVELRRSGKNFREIAAEMGTSVSTAFRDWTSVIDLTIAEAKESADQQRMLCIERHERLYREAENIAFGHVACISENTEPAELQLKAIDRCCKILDQLARLMGLYAAIETNVEIKTDTRDRVLNRLASIAAARAANGVPGGTN